MLFMIELHYDDQHRTEALGYFWSHGATHYEGAITLESVWVATAEQIAYVLVHSESEEQVELACVPLKAFGAVEHHRVYRGDDI